MATVNGTNGSANGHSPPLTANAEEIAKRIELRERRADIVFNALLSRQDWLRKQSDPRRDIDDECGFPKGIVTPELYQTLFDREAIAARVVEVMPRESWQVTPQVYEDEDSEVSTPFEERWDSIGKRLRGEHGWHKEEAGSAVWEYLRRADELSGVGAFGVILLGLDDDNGGDLSLPVEPMEYDESGGGGKAGRNLIYLRVFPESLVQINSFDPDPASPRYGQPLRYTITFNSPTEQHAGIGLVVATRDVHWTRIIHVADVSHQASSSEVFAVPRQRPVLNNLLSLQKLYGGSAEMYWKGAFPGLSLETHPQLGGDVDIDRTAMKEMMEDYQNGLQRYLTLMGMSANPIAPQVVDPSPQIGVQIEAICIKIGCPIRVFKGSERGELASSQDDASWNDRLRDRQHKYLTPRMICPLVDRLIWLGVLPEPEEGYSVYWPDLASQTDGEKAAVGVQKTTALVQYSGSEAKDIVTPRDFLTMILRFTDEEADMIIENAEAAQEEADAEEMSDLGLSPDDPTFGGLLTSDGETTDGGDGTNPTDSTSALPPTSGDGTNPNEFDPFAGLEDA